jgi:hypothetical protein
MFIAVGATYFRNLDAYGNAPASIGAFRQSEIPFVVQRCERGRFVGKSLENARRSEPSQADDEGSIPFTRSNLFNYLSAEDGALTRLG